MNSSVVNFVWKRIAKPFQNGYLSANKQFIAPLPIPGVKASVAHKIAELSRNLTKMHTDRRETLGRLEKRFEACDVEEKPPEWLWPSAVKSFQKWKTKAPSELTTRQKNAWAKDQQSKEIKLAIEALGERLRPLARLEVELVKGELRVLDEGAVILDGVFVDKGYGEQTLIDWRNYFRSNPLPETPDAKGLASDLRNIRVTDNAAAAKQIADLDSELSILEQRIETSESELNKVIAAAYALTAPDLNVINSQNP